MNDQTRRDAGMNVRRKVLGNSWVDKSIANRNAFNTDFQDLITRYAWGEIWTRPHFDERTRRVLVIGTLVALGQWDEFRLHVRAALAEGGFTPDDMGTINTALADEFPHDRLATTFFRRDDNFSLYSYNRFYDYPPKDQIMSMWNADTLQLTAELETRENLYYFIPYWRNLNSSHCTTVLTFAGSDIDDQNVTLAGWISDFVNDKPVTSHLQDPVPGEDP